MGTVCLSRKSRGASSQVRAQGVCRVEKHQWGWGPGGGPGTLSKASGSQEGSGVKEGEAGCAKGGSLGSVGGQAGMAAGGDVGQWPGERIQCGGGSEQGAE